MSDAPIVWMNGELVSADELRVSPFDLGLTVGLGVFETMIAYDGKVFAYDLHHARLERSAAVLGIAVPEQAVIEAAAHELIEANGGHAGRLRVRLAVSGGLNLLQGGDAQGNVMATATALADTASVAKLVQVPFAINERAATVGVKSASYADHVLAYRYALREGGDEALMCNTRGQLCEGAMSNVFLVKDGVVKTPSLGSGCLAGVTRGLVIGLCAELGIAVKECDLYEKDVLEADEWFLTSSVREVQPAVMMEDDGDAAKGGGEVSKRLSAAYVELVRRELAL